MLDNEEIAVALGTTPPEPEVGTLWIAPPLEVDPICAFPTVVEAVAAGKVPAGWTMIPPILSAAGTVPVIWLNMVQSVPM